MRFDKIRDDKVPAMGQGTGTGWAHCEYSESALRFGIQHGLTLIDTAELYVKGKSEKIIGNVIASNIISRDELFICTKFSPEVTRSQDIIKAAERSLCRLATSYIDLYQVHWPNPETPLEEIVEAFDHLIEKGKVKHIGVCNFPLSRLNRLVSLSSTPIASHQIEYSLFDRSQEQLTIPFCKENDIAIISFSPLSGGDLKIKPILKEISEAYSCSCYQLALYWIYKNQSISIPGSTNCDHILSNTAALDLDISDRDMSRIDAAYTPVIQEIPADQIIITDAVLNGYKTIHEAKINRFNLKPGPMDLVKELENGESVKPIKVVLTERGYELTQGQMRYWASVIAYGMQFKLCCLVEEL